MLLVASLTYHYFRGFTPLARPFDWRPVTAHQQLGARMAAQIDPALPLFAPLNLNPHVSSRRVLHQNFDDIAPDDWLWLDVASLPNENNIQQYIRDELLPHYEIVQADDGYLLLKPDNSKSILHNSQLTIDNLRQFHTFTRPASGATPQYPLSVVFGDGLQLIGYDLRFNRAEEVQVLGYWRALKPMPADVAPILFLMDGDGNFKGATSGRTLSPTMIWLPADRWPVGKTIVVAFNKFTWETRSRKAYRLGIGLSTAEDPWDVGARWRPVVQKTSYANHLMSDRTVLELARFERVAGMSEGAPPFRQMSQPIVQHRLEATFSAVSPQVRLIGYNAPKIIPSAGATVLRLDLLWQGLGLARGDYVRFVHALGPNGQLWGQWDSPPVNGTYPTPLWAEGEFVWDSVEVPLANNSPPGAYTLRVGLYDPLSGQRLLTERGQDHIKIDLRIGK